MKRKQIGVLITVFLFINVASFSLILTTNASTPEEILDTEPLLFDNTPERFNYDINFETLTPSAPQMAAAGGGLSTAAAIGDVRTWLSLDDYKGYYFFTDFELRGLSDNTEVWIQLDRSYGLEHEERNEPTYQDEDGFYYYPEITQAQIDYLLEQFDTNIYPKDTLYYGTPDFHDGSASLLEAWGYFDPGTFYDVTGRNIILVSNVRDAMYYTDFRFYIAGFFSSSLEAYFDRNIISIDSHQWYRRVGPEGTVWHSEILDIDYPAVDRPFVYEATIAHEYQHLLHSDYVPGDLLIMNEGFSTFAEYLCGYGVPTGDINYFLATPDNSLIDWGDQEGDNNILADYGQAFMWTAYLNDHFGGPDFLSYFMEAGIPGVAGVENALNQFGFDLTFDELFHDWRIANLIHSDWPGCGKYNYDTFDLGDVDTFIPIRVYNLENNTDYDGSHYPQDLTGYGFGHTVCWDNFDLFDTFLVSSYGSDYVRFENLNWCYFNSKFEFNGQDEIPVAGWVADGERWGFDTWYSGGGDLIDRIHAAYITVPDSGVVELTFDTYWDIEDYWDFGFVQVSTDDGETWTSLANEYTTGDHDPAAHSDIVANLPGLTSWSGFITLDGWLNMSFDLSGYLGQEILLGFRYMTDWETTYEGWYISNVVIEQDGVVVQTVNDFFTPYPKTEFMVTLIREDHISYWYRRRLYTKTVYTIIYDMKLDENNDGSAWLFPFTGWHSDMIAIITPLKGPADYSFSLSKFCWRWW